MQLVGRVKWLYESVVRAFVVIGCVFIVLMAVFIGANVIIRYFVPAVSLSWVTEVTPWMLIYVTFLAAGWLLRSEGHVKLELVYERLAPRTADLVSAVTSVLAAVMWLIVGSYGVLATLEDIQGDVVTMTTLQVPEFAILMALPIGSFILVVEVLRRAYRHALRYREQGAKAMAQEATELDVVEKEATKPQWNGM